MNNSFIITSLKNLIFQKRVLILKFSKMERRKKNNYNSSFGRRVPLASTFVGFQTNFLLQRRQPLSLAILGRSVVRISFLRPMLPKNAMETWPSSISNHGTILSFHKHLCLPIHNQWMLTLTQGLVMEH